LATVSKTVTKVSELIDVFLGICQQISLHRVKHRRIGFCEHLDIHDFSIFTTIISVNVYLEHSSCINKCMTTSPKSLPPTDAWLQ
jgi:hypothetical protein